MTAWRVDESHHLVQRIGREEVFSDYRIRIAQVLYGAKPRGAIWQPERLTPYNDPNRRARSYVLATESKSPTLPVNTDWCLDAFESVYREGRYAHIVDLPDYLAGLELGRQLFLDPTTEYFRVFEVMRDYGMYDRREAPQYYPAIERPAQSA